GSLLSFDGRASLPASIRCARGFKRKSDQRIPWPVTRPKLPYQNQHRKVFLVWLSSWLAGHAASQPCLLLLGRLGCRVPRMAPNVEVNLHGLLDLDKSDLNGNKDRVQLGSSGA
ncbi:hypothetical protein Tco_1188655, partial [Tanacetum coccineum]